ncbi:MAG: HNH endonuclease [Isosphaeraceae bacterium]
MNPLYPLVAQRAGHRCEYCRAPEAIFNLPFEVEHIVPTSREGPDDESNCALACRSCNLYKSDQVEGRDDVTQEVVRLFEPRRDRWHEHFRIERDTATVLGLTPTGRATVAALQMNRAVQLAARQQWMLLGLFP